MKQFRKANARAKITANPIAQTNDRSQAFVQEEASTPAATAQQNELKFVEADNTASCQLTPPISNGRASTGRTATHMVRARNPCVSVLARTMLRAVSGVRKSRPKVPSRRSRLIQSAVTRGTNTQMEHNN